MTAAPHQQTCCHPLLQLSVAFASGILFANISRPSLSPLLIAAVVATAAGILLQKIPWISTVVVTLSFFLLGATYHALEKKGVGRDRVTRLFSDRKILPDEPVQLTGMIDGPPAFGPELLFLDLQIQSIRIKETEAHSSGVVRLYLPLRSIEAHEYDDLELRHGARINVFTSLSRSDRFRNPGVPSFTEFLEMRGYDAIGFVKSPLLVERLDDEAVFLPLAWLYEWRQTLDQKISVTFTETTASIIRAALLGNRGALSASTAERFRDGGTFHVLVISGLHISFIGGVAFLFIRRITEERSLQFVLSTALLWSYTLAVGAGSSVVRASFMFSFVTFAPIVKRRAASMNSMGAAVLVLLALRPVELFDPSFQLTFLSVAAIIAVSLPFTTRMAQIGGWRPSAETPFSPTTGWFRDVCDLLYWSEKLWRKEVLRTNYSYKLFKNPWATRLERCYLQPLLRYAFNAIVVSTCVQLTLLPLLILYMHRFSLASLVLNIGVGAMMAALLLVAVVTLLISLASPLIAGLLVWLSEGIAWLMVHSVDPFSALRLASIRVPEYTGPFSSIYFLYYIPLIGVAYGIARWNPLGAPDTFSGARRLPRCFRLFTISQALITAIIIGHPYSPQSTAGHLRVDFLDVGQGDAALITAPDGTTVLIDGGGQPQFRRPGDPKQNGSLQRSRSIGEAVVSEFLWNRGLSTIDYIVATHADADHVDGLNDIVRNFAVRAAFVGRPALGDAEYERFSNSLSSAGVPVFSVGAGDIFRFGEVKVLVLHPHKFAAKAKSANDDSVVLKVELGSRAILFTGDIEKRAEAMLLMMPDRLRADVVKVAHHGSRTSSEARFVGATGAKLAVISVGRNSFFGHPHPDVIQRWRASGARVLTTGNCGAITATTDGSELKVTTFVGASPEGELTCAFR
ncbi:MAG TPA: ComEC/Rec2 family competence protein [Pyrinomonadaceae bacterium]|nr:ComEC/Rec2 family competence protein [Pyrinomonadaceae bacterium]